MARLVHDSGHGGVRARSLAREVGRERVSGWRGNEEV